MGNLIHDSDAQFETSLVEKAEACSHGWDVKSTNGWSLLVPIDRCAVYPKPGEEMRLYGRGMGYPIRGIVIAGRVYRYETSTEHEVSQAAMHAKLTAEREAVDEAWRNGVSRLPPLPVMQCKDPEAWAACVKLQSNDAYSYACVRYAVAWARLMESRGELAQEPTERDAQQIAQIAKNCSHEADTEGITGFMYGAAVSMLSRFWTHGEALRRWHNKDTQIGTEGDKANESGGVLNPAILSMKQ